MNGDDICGFRFSVYCATNARTSFYADPYHHMCSYHGVETDLLNLTACVGYELWRVSTTCTLVLESVKASGVIFLLGVGSYVCYRLYRGYKRRFWPPAFPKGKRLSRWISQELLDSCLSQEEDVLDVKREYFGPAEQSDDNTSGSEFGGLLISFLPNSYCSKQSVKEKRTRKIPGKRMGNSHSASHPYETVSYNVQKGVNLFQHSQPLPVGLASIPSSYSSSPSIVCRTHSLHNNSFNNGNLHGPPKCLRPRPKSLPLRKKKTRTHESRRLAAEGLEALEQLFQLSTSTKSSRRSDCSSDSGDSLHSPRYFSDDEDNNDDGDDEDEEYLERSGFRFPKDKDLHSRSGSLQGNFSPGSLLNRHLGIFPPDSRLPPDGIEGPARAEAPSIRKNIFVIQSSNSISPEDDESDSSKLERHDTVNYEDVCVALGLEHADGFHQFSPQHRLVRDGSFGSECSELSVDTSAFNEVGRSTEAKIDKIQKEIEDVKKDFMDMESHIGIVDFHGPTPTAYTELVKSTLSDISECSDGQTSENVDHLKRKAAFGATFSQDTPPNATAKILNFKSCESSFDQSSTSSSSQPINSSANLSFEWDSMKCVPNNTSNTSARIRRKWALGSGPINSSMISNNSVVQVDSGSDFGTPLTNGSPEPVSRGRSSSVISLEWEEEFDQPINVRVDEDILPPSKRKQKVASPAVSYAHEKGSCGTLRPNSFPADPSSNPSSSSKLMWSSVESGYIEEFSESCGSRQITPLKDDMQYSCHGMADLRNHPTADSAYFEGKELNAEAIRTWPVVEKKQKLEEQNGLSNDFVKKCNLLGFGHLRPIYKDGNGIFRAVLLQMLSYGYSPLVQSGGLDQVKRKFSLWMRCHHQWLCKWNFNQKLNYSRENCLQGMLDCLQTLDWLTNSVLNSANKEQVIVDSLNMDPEAEQQVMEACKLLIMKSVVELHDDMIIDRIVPVFALLLFSRESTMDPEAYLCHHLNDVGDARAPDEMDLFLLSHALGVAICVLHPGKVNQDDMITYHPDNKIGSWPEIYLIYKEENQQYCAISR